LTPAQLLRRLYARRGLFLKTSLLSFIAIGSLISAETPRYTASVSILIEAPPGRITDPLQPVSQSFPDAQKIASEIQVLRSRALADKAIAELKLADRSEFNPALSDSSWLDRMLTQLFGNRRQQSTIISRYYDRLSVSQIGTSRVIALGFSSQDPQLARDAANTLSMLYLADQREARLALNSQAADWLTQQIEALRQRVAISEGKVEEFRARNGLLETAAGTELQSQELTELSGQLTAARAARAEAEARVETLQRLIAPDQTTGETADSALEVLQSPLIQQLRAQEVQLTRELTQLNAELLPTHPTLVRKEAELADLNRQIHTETQKIIAGARNQARFMAAREVSLRRDLEQMKGRSVEANRDQIALRALEREAAADRTLLETFLGRLAEVTARGELSIQEADARIISPAGLPETPSHPPVVAFLFLAALVSSGLGLSSVFVADLRSKTVRDARDLEGVGLTVFAALPKVRRRKSERTTMPRSEAYDDGIRALHAALGVTPARNQRGRIIMVTSTSRGEGRTTTTIALARSMAQSGVRVLVIDTDFEQPGLTHCMGVPAGAPGFTDLLTGRAGYEQVIMPDPGSAAQIIPAGGEYAVSPLASPKFQAIMDGLARAYDVILLDCGPVTRSADPQTLSRVSDQCIYAVQWDVTERDATASALRRLAIAGTRAGIGAVLTRANLTSLS
jgi:uncharacterized protein involved in exopolysaccharide biosynthesis/Mrp family chromosome partitioning ATPase